VHALRIEEDALWAGQSPTGPKEPIGWDSLVLMAAYQIVKKESFHRWSASYNMATNTSDLRADKYSKDYKEYLADLVATLPNGSLRRLRVESRELNYPEALGTDAADPLTRANAREDSFRLVLARVHARATRITVPPETLVLLGGEPNPDHRLCHLPRLEDFEAYNRWLLQKTRLAGFAG
jgi:hypothetical protein